MLTSWRLGSRWLLTLDHINRMRTASIDFGSDVTDNTFRTNSTAQRGSMTNRLDVRLDVEHRRRLEKSAQEKGEAISDIVRGLIDGAYEDIMRMRRKEAIERLIALNVEDPPDPDTLSRELEAAHEPGGLY